MATQLFETTAPMPAKPRVQIDLVGDELILRWRRVTWGPLLFLMLWLTGWSAGCGVMFYKLLTEFEWFMLLFSVPFFTAWFVVAGLVIYMLFGRQCLVLGRHSLQATTQALITISDREVPIDEVELAQVDENLTHQENGPPTRQWMISINTLGSPVEFAKGIDEAEAEWLAETINVCLNRMAPDRAAMTSRDAVRKRDAESRDLDEGFSGEPIEDELDDQQHDVEERSHRAVVFVPSRDRWERPSDSSWQLSREGRALVFINRGRWSLAAILGSLFICLFWNGIVSVFVLQLFEDFQWFLAIFLIPFEVIGLVILFALLAALTAPAWGSRYTFRLGRIEHRWWCPLFGRTKQFDFDRLDRIELAQGGTSNKVSNPPIKFSTTQTSTGEYRLALIDTSNTTLLEIDSLTKGESLWIADTLMCELPGMFDRDR
ncbi:hypothetical protein [Aeoliella sp.]|uniref:hypothetical protein n=1 Tax=Aeoliella sp. TaxID=2795800 RepID=UPI003CCC2CED